MNIYFNMNLMEPNLVLYMPIYFCMDSGKRFTQEKNNFK
jgi:hypothetical protein